MTHIIVHITYTCSIMSI